MLSGLPLLLVIFASIFFIVIACTKFKVHPFIALLLASIFTALATGMPLTDITKTAAEGFGGMMMHIGIVVILGTLIGTVLQKSGATLRIAAAIISLFGKNKPVMAITIIGAIIGIPIFCDSGYVILSGLTKPLAKKTGKSYSAIVGGLSGGLYITHTLLPPHPGSLAGAANLGLSQHLGIVIIMGLIISIPVTIVTWLFANKVTGKMPYNLDNNETLPHQKELLLPSLTKSLLPVIIPVALIAAGSLTSLAKLPALVNNWLQFAGSPIIALLVGLALSLLLVKKTAVKQFQQWMQEGVAHAGPILILVGAGGVFGNVLKKTPLAAMVQQWVSADVKISTLAFLLIAFLIGTLLKTAQGSTTSAIIVATSILGPIATVAGFKEPLQLSLLLSATAAGAMMISHANDAYFWVISQFSELNMQQTYRTFSLATIVMSLATITMVMLLAMFMLS
jgi:gluconate:H+ symporter, GntP family